MMEYATEEQQVEAIKKWFNTYGNALSWAVIIILGTALLFKYWFHHKEVLLEQASDSYAMLLVAMDKKDDVSVKHQAENLLKEYPSTIYATFASLALANEALREQNIEMATQQLTWVMEHAKQEDFRGLARIRLMRLLISQDKLPEALALYDERKAKAYLPIMAELKGDILLNQNDRKGAIDAYQKAYRLAPKEEMIGYLLKVKLEELGVDPNSLSDKEVKAKS